MHVFQTNGRFCKIKQTISTDKVLVKDMKMSFHSCLETNTSGIGIARGAPCPICNVCSNLVHCIEADNSNIALEYSPGAIIPPKTLTPLPVGDATIACLANPNGRFGPKNIK